MASPPNNYGRDLILAALDRYKEAATRAESEAYQRKIEQRFGRFRKALRRYGKKTGTGHKRILVPKKLLKRRDLKRLGFVPVTAAIPEAGQIRMRSFRHPDHNYHLHEHRRNWTMHRDNNPASSMLALREAQKPDGSGLTPDGPSLWNRVKTTITGLPHTLTEGVPGMAYYLGGRLTGAPGMKTKLEKALPSAYFDKIDDWKVYKGVAPKKTEELLTPPPAPVPDLPPPATIEAPPLAKAAAEFAPGIPPQRPISRLPRITEKTMNRWMLAVQNHEATRAGKHFDLRLVDPDAGKAHSWAIPKARLPAPGEKLLAVQTFTHTPEYALHFGDKKPGIIGQGYGKGRVRMALKEPTDIIEANNDKVRFNTYRGRELSEYLLRRTKNDKWLLQNTTTTREKRPDLPDSKPKYREVTPDAVDVADNSQLMMAKVDGAHNTFVLDRDNPVRVFSYRPTERDTGVIEHTHRFLPGLRTRVPKELDGLILRGELAASDPHTGRIRDSVDTGAILNSGVWKSREAQQHSPLRAVIFDVARRAGENVEKLPYREKLKILERVTKKLPFLEMPPLARTAKEKVNLLNRIRTGQEPITSEGVVLWPMDGGAPIRSKFRPDHDVYVRKIYPEEGKREGLAGGFSYSWTPQGKIQGNVGTGLKHELKRDMLENPREYLGRVARVQAQGVYRDKSNPKKPGALRAPAFRDWHLDKNLGKVS